VDLATGQQREPIRLGKTSVAALAFSPDGRKLAILQEGMVFVWDVAGRQSSRLIASDWRLGMFGIFYTHDGKGLITARRHAELWSAETGERLRHFGPFNDLAHSVAISPDGKHALTTHMGSDLRLWEIETGTFFRRFGRDVNPPR